MNRMLLAVLALLATLSAANPAAALEPIDDFEIGDLALWTAPNNNCVFDTLLLNGYEPHVISQVRIVTLCGIGDQACTAYITPDSPLDDALLFTAGGNETDFVRVLYNWGFPRTLTYGGLLDRIEVSMIGVVPGGRLTITIWDANNAKFAARTLTSSGIVTFPLSDFAGVNLEQAMRMQVTISSSGLTGAFLISDIRLRGNGYWAPATTVNFEGDFVATEVPPIPSPPLSFRLFSEQGAALYRTDLAVTRAEAEGPQPSLTAQWSEAFALGGEIAGVEFMGIDPQPFRDTAFELAFDLFTAGSGVPEILSEPTLSANPLGFLLTFPVRLTNGAGDEIGRSETRIVFDVHEGQAIEIQDVQLIPGSTSSPGADDGFLVSFTLDVIGGIDQEQPLFEGTWIADWSQKPPTEVSGATPAGAVTALVAHPSVTRSETEIRAGIPFGPGSAIALHDASGRLVRRLRVPIGASSMRWDGRDDRGMPVSSGVYFARAESAPSSEPARIVLVR